MKNFILNINKIILLPIAGITACTGTGNKKSEKENSTELKPNILFILVDDLGWKDLGCYGSDFYETPNIDRLAAEGVRFTDAYASCPVCSPTRASIMTGKYPTRHGITDWIPGRQNEPGPQPYEKMLPKPFKQQLDLDEITIAEMLSKNGYQSRFFGKWHLGDSNYYPDKQGFDINYGGCHKGGPWGQGAYYYPWPDMPNLEGKEGDFLPYKLTDYVMDFIEESKDTSFFAFLSFYSVHVPIMAPDTSVEKYIPKVEELGYTPDQRFDTNDTWAANLPEDQQKRAIERKVQDNAKYAAMINVVDQNVGRLLDLLAKLELEKNTIIVFTSDNGGLINGKHSATSLLPLRGGKGWVYEGGIRVPLIIKWPGKGKSNHVANQLAISNDFYPTLLEMCSIEINSGYPNDGISLVPALKGEMANERALFWHYPHSPEPSRGMAGAIREGNYKLIENYENGNIELYDLQNDIGEKYNLVDSLPGKVKELKQEFGIWKKETGAKMPVINKKYRN
jgi:arylsulfatase A-like enzyme